MQTYFSWLLKTYYTICNMWEKIVYLVSFLMILISHMTTQVENGLDKHEELCSFCPAHVTYQFWENLLGEKFHKMENCTLRINPITILLAFGFPKQVHVSLCYWVPLSPCLREWFLLFSKPVNIKNLQVKRNSHSHFSSQAIYLFPYKLWLRLLKYSVVFWKRYQKIFFIKLLWWSLLGTLMQGIENHYIVKHKIS